MKVSIVIRTYNEIRHLPDLFRAIKAQKTPGVEVEIVLVDSGSTDGTLEVAQANGAKEVFISREEFSFGRSLNRGCAAATGDALVFVSGHCIPVGPDWLANLTAPVLQGRVAYAYGKQRGGGNTKYSEHQLFKKYFPDQSKVPQDGFFCNNANACLSRAVWHSEPFNEQVTGLEDMELAKRLMAKGHKIGYVAEAEVSHLHDETWKKIKWRYEREALALQGIMPQVHVSKLDKWRYIFSGIFLDYGVALSEGRFHTEAWGILRFRIAQYGGSYRGNHLHRKISKKDKEHYFYPR